MAQSLLSITISLIFVSAKALSQIFEQAVPTVTFRKLLEFAKAYAFIISVSAGTQYSFASLPALYLTSCFLSFVKSAPFSAVKKVFLPSTTKEDKE